LPKPASWLSFREKVQNAEIIYISQRLETIECPSPVLEIGAGWTPELHRGPFRKKGYTDFLSHDAANDQRTSHDFLGDICITTTIPEAVAGTALLFNVLEHVYAPWLAVDEVWRVMKSGGVLLGSVPLRTAIHRWDKDYWRFCPDGVGYLLRRFRLMHLALDGNASLPANLLFAARKDGDRDWAADNQEVVLRPEIIVGNDYVTPSRWKKAIVNAFRRWMGVSLEQWDGPWNKARLQELGFKEWTVVDYEAEARARGMRLHA
jgi:SAM-dependent methyltransferase